MVFTTETRRSQRGHCPQPTWEGEAGVMKRTKIGCFGVIRFR